MIALNELHGVATFRHAKPPEITEVLRLGVIRRFARVETLFEQGEGVHSFYLLLGGWAQVSLITSDGKQVFVRLTGPGDFCGITTLLSLPDYPTTARALASVRAVAWTMACWQQLVRSQPCLAVCVMDAMGRHISEAHTRIAELSTEEAERRIAHTVLRLACRAGEPVIQGLRIPFLITRQDIAEMSGTTMHNASRIMSAWRARGVVGGGRQGLVVRDIDALERVAEGPQS